jgi:hypothetical protein
VEHRWDFGLIFQISEQIFELSASNDDDLWIPSPPFLPGSHKAS